MKGILHKTDKGWIVTESIPLQLNFIDGIQLPIHPFDEQHFTMIEGKEVEFREVTFESGVFDLPKKYQCAQIVLPTKRPIDYLDECIKSSPQMVKENSSIPTKASENLTFLTEQAQELNLGYGSESNRNANIQMLGNKDEQETNLMFPPESSWDDIIHEFSRWAVANRSNEDLGRKFANWLKQYYHPPLKR